MQARRTLQALDKRRSGKAGKAPAAQTVASDARQEQTAPVETKVNEQGADAPKAESASRQARKPKEPRASTSDGDARVMKMADGGFRPAFDAQLALDSQTMLITGMDIVNSGSDRKQMLAMHEQHAQRYARAPEEWLADAGLAQARAHRATRRARAPCSLRCLRPRIANVTGTCPCPATVWP